MIGALSFGVVLWVLGAAAHIVGEVRRGWALVRGVVPPPLALADIRRQLETSNASCRRRAPIEPASRPPSPWLNGLLSGRTKKGVEDRGRPTGALERVVTAL